MKSFDYLKRRWRKIALKKEELEQEFIIEELPAEQFLLLIEKLFHFQQKTINRIELISSFRCYPEELLKLIIISDQNFHFFIENFLDLHIELNSEEEALEEEQKRSLKSLERRFFESFYNVLFFFWNYGKSDPAYMKRTYSYREILKMFYEVTKEKKKKEKQIETAAKTQKPIDLENSTYREYEDEHGHIVKEWVEYIN